MNLISKILYRTQKISQLITAIFGVFLGFLLILTSSQLFTDFKNIIQCSEQAIGSQFLVINKKISLLNTFNIGNSSFTESEIKEIESNPCFKKVGKFTTNKFEAQASIQFPIENTYTEIRTDLFLESVDDDFLDIKPKDWHWNIKEDEIPIILPNDFINLYNFNYAPGRGLPQISKSTIKLANFKIEIRGIGGNSVYKGKIVGFSNRITSVLVPYSFMEYANKIYGLSQNNNESLRLIVEAKNNELSNVQNYIEKKGYEANSELLKNGKIASLLQAILSIIAFFGAIMIVISVSSLILYIQLSITRSKFEIETLLKLGFSHHKIVQWYAYKIAFVLALVYAINVIVLVFIKSQTNALIETFGFEAPKVLNVYVLLSSFLILLIIWSFQIIAVYRQIFKLALPLKN
jgi:hypothetical protein